MPARKEKKTKKNATDFSKRREIFKNSESYKSLFYGVATVIILFILGIGVAKLFLNHPKPEIDSQAVSISRIDEVMQEAKKNNNTYAVQENESLWDVAVKKYNDGYKWVDIARVNNLANPDTIFTGDKLIIPVVKESSAPAPETAIQVPLVTPEVTLAQPDQMQPAVLPDEKITGNTYTVKAGDDLWDVAVRAYGDGYKWVDIASANNLSDPGLIFSDNVLQIPR